MQILFCKISCMKYYKGVNENDVPHNGGSFVDENGYGHEEYNFAPEELPDGKVYCLGFVETKSHAGVESNDLHIEKISGCELLKNEESVDGVLVVWCATTDLNETSVVGWYKNATVYRRYRDMELDSGYIQSYNILAFKDDCVLLPRGERHRHIWAVPVARKRGFAFGQSMLWYASEANAKKYLSDLVRSIEEYDGENMIDADISE